MRCVDLYNQSQSKWFEEMVTTSLVRDHVLNMCALVCVRGSCAAVVYFSSNLLHLTVFYNCFSSFLTVSMYKTHNVNSQTDSLNDCTILRPN